ncbi:unnamed protein product [Wickerhamomyces anomalus]
MRYLRKFSGDQITVEDMMPISHDINLDIPEIKKNVINLNDLPIRVKTRFRGKKGNPTRRVVSTPIFDLVTRMEDMSIGLMPPPKFKDELSSSSPKPKALPKARKPPMDFKNLPPTPVQRFQNQQQKRQVSMPIQLNQTEKPLHQLHDYTNIIQIYEENSPFGVMPTDQSPTTPQILNSHHNLSSPEVNSASSASSDIEPSVITKYSDQNPQNFKSKLHPRDSIRYMRNYDEYHDQFEIKTKTPPILPQHTINVIKKDAYYKSRANFEGEAQSHDPSAPQSPCNERDTSIFTRRSRRLPSLPANIINSDIISSTQQHNQLIHQFQSPGYRGGLRVVNRVPS